MKLKREIIAIMLIICMLFTISAISAADSGDDAIGVANDTVEATTQDYSVQSNNDVEILNAVDNNALYDLQQTINSTTDGSTVVLDKDYEYNMDPDYETRGYGVIIDKNLTIDGQNHKIDGKGESAIFFVNTGVHVTFKDIVFMNGKAYYGGGAIYSQGSVIGNVINCTFIKNTNVATNRGGGAINVRSDNWNIINSTFINNTDSSNYGGGAIYALYGDFNIVNSEFINNSGNYGGAIFLYDATTQIINSTFEKNKGSYGGAVYVWYATSQIYSSTFENNEATSGGAVYLYQSNNYMDSSTFENNDATYGGVVYSYQSNNYIDNSTFENNDAIYYGGAIYGAAGGIINSTDSKFVNNSANSYGGAIYGISECIIISIDSKFVNNSANYGGVIYASESNLTSIDSMFINNSGEYGGAIYSKSGTSDVNNSTFINNSALSYTGGAIYTYDGTVLKSINSNFINNSARSGGAIGSHSGRIQINNSTFKNNKASSNGGAILGAYSMDDDLGIIANSTFINNFAASDGGAISSDNGDGGTVDRCIFINNTVSDVSRSSSAIYYINQIKNSIFLNHEGRYIYSNNPILSNNWFENTVDNFDECPLIVNERPFVDNWYYFDVTSKGNHLIWSLKLYNRSTGESSVVENYNLPDITFSLTPQNLTIDTRKMKMNKTGQYDLEYALTSETGWLSVQYETFKYDLEVREAEFDALQELINSANPNDEIILTRNYTYTLHIDSIVNGIVIDKPGLTIDGNGFTIDARGQSRIFNVTENAHGVTIKNVILTNGSASEGSVIYSEGENLNVCDSILLNNGENQIYVTDSSTIEKCWFGHTYENYTFGEYVAPSSALKSWYYLDIDDETANHAIVTLKLYDAATKQSSIDDDYNLPEITFKLSKENLNFDETEIKLNKSGQYDVEYTSVSAKGSITAEYETSKFKKVIGETDFERLQRYINEANAGDVINLYGDFIYQDGDTQIEITKRLTIDGHGFTIDAKNQCNIFNIHDAEYPGVVLKNIKFTNSKTSSWGSAIYSLSNMYIINCTFVNGTANGAGFVYLLYTSYVTNCTFINGTGSSSAGAIYVYDYAGRTEISGCTFINSTSGDGGAIFLNGENSIISNCTFINGAASYGGGAIRSSVAHSVINSTFINNTASVRGGALQGYSPNMYVFNNTFINNTSPNGGAIWNNENNLDVINCTFTYNTATNGGAVCVEGGNVCNVINSTFTNNSVSYGGGAIYSSWWGPSLKVINSTFFNNSGDCGAAVYIGSSNSLIFNSTFIKNRETGTRSIVHNDRDNLKIDKCLFIENMGEDHWAAMVYGQSDTVVSNSIFLNNHARRVFSNGPFTIDNNWYGSTIDNYDQVPIGGNGEVIPDNWLFVNATFDREMNITDIYSGKFVFQSYNNGEVSNYDASKLHDVNLTLSAEKGEIDKRSAEMGDEITYTPTQLGTGKITANFFKNLGVSDKYVDITFEIIKTPTEISLDETSITVLAHHNILDEISPAVSPADVEGAFTYTTDDSTIIDVTNPQLISGLKAGTAQLTITFNPTNDDSYESSSITLDVTVNKDTSGITAEPISFDYGGEPKNIEVNLTPEYLNNLYKSESVGLTFISTNTSVFTVDTNGKITPKTAGKANLTIRYEESDDYLASEKNITVTVNKVDSELILGNDIVFNYLSSNTTTFTVNGGSVEEANIKVIGHDEAVIDLTGNVITVSNLTVGTYTLNVTTTPDANHTAVSKTLGITVNRIAPTITIENGETDNVNVKSSKTIIATVDCGADLTYAPNETGIVSLEDNVVTGLKAGKVNITVSVLETENYLAGSKNITITVNRIDAGIDASDFNVDVNADKEISVNKPTDYNGEITYESKTPAVASVDNNGKVTGITGGDATITIKWTQTDLYKQGSYDVTVTVKKITADISAVPLTVNVSETKGLTVNKPGDFDGTIVYTPQNPDNVTVGTNGDVTGLRGGDVVITLSWAESPKYLEGSETVTVTVNKIKPTITIGKGETTSVDAGSTLDIGASGSGTLTFKSNNTAVATVDANGVVTGVIAGVVNITVYSAENDQYLPGSKNITVTVNKIEAKINASDIDVNVKDTNSLVVQKPDDYPSAEITFESQNSNIAYVGQDGVVSGKIGGDAVITISWEETEKYLPGIYNVNVHVEKLPANLHAQDLEVEYNHTKQISATYDSNGVLSYGIADNNIATFENGNVNGLKIGETTLTISISETDEYHSDSIEVPVKVVKTSPNLQAEAVLLHVGNTEHVVVKHLGDGALSYEITDTSIATVDDEGNVSGVSDGTTTLKISIAESENYTSQFINVNVVVTNKQIGNIIIPGSQEYSVDVDGTLFINATTNSKGILSFSVNDTSVASLSGKYLTGIKGGEVEVTITLPETSEYSGLTVTKKIKVNKLTPVITIDNGDSDVVEVDGNLIISAHPTSNCDITYASNDTHVATVDSLGNVTGIIGGKVNITVKSVENDKFKESTKNIIVTVKKLTPVITINNGNPVSVDVHSTVNINATKGDSDGILRYSSGNESRAVIDTKGNIRGVAGYPVVITVSVSGTERYLAGSVDVPVQVNKIDPVITINNVGPVSVDADKSFVIDASANGAVLTYDSCNDSIAVVGTDGNVTGLIGGVVNITVYAAETDEYLAGSKNLTVTVNKLTPVITIDNGDSDVVEVDGNLIISAHPTSNCDITYESNDTHVATVDSAGNVTGIIGGKVNITVKSVENDKFKESTKNIIVTVNKLTPTITINNGNPVLVDVHSTVNINATTDSDDVIEYVSADEAIAGIDTEGNVTGVTGGVVNITVSVPETERYLSNSVNITVQVNKIAPVITINNAEPVSVDAEDSFVIDASANGAVLTYASCNDSIAVVGADGNVTGLIGGVVNITVYAAETNEYLAGSKNLTVTVNKINPVITPEALVLDVFETKHLNVSIPDDFKGTIVYTSQNPENITVDGQGNVTGHKGGNAVITLSWNETDKYLEGITTATVTVNKINPIITIKNGESTSVGVKNSFTIDASANGATLSYESNDTSIAVVDINTGRVTGQKAGTANITVYAAETDEYLPGSKNITVTVNKKPSTIIVYGESSVDVFSRITLEYQTESAGRKLVFESSDSEIASVSQSGVVYGLKSGEVTITVTALENDEYLEKSATWTITVNKIKPQIGLDAANITVGETENAYITVPDPGRVYIALSKDSQVLYSAMETLNNNYYKYTNADLAVGNYTITAKYYGSSRYTENTISKDFIVRPIYKYEFDVEAEDTVIGNEVNVTVTLPEDAKGIIKIEDNEYEITGKKTVITLPAQTKSGKNNVTVEYVASEDSKYDSSQITARYNVAKKESKITIDVPDDVKVGNEIAINVTADTAADLVVTIDGVHYDVVEGKVKLTPSASGLHNITVSADENGEFKAVNKTVSFVAVKKDALIVIGDISAEVGDKVPMKFVNETDGALTVKVNGKEVSGDYEIVKAGTYVVTVESAETDNYTAGFDTYTFTVDKLQSEVNLNVIPGKSGEKSVIKFNVTDGATGTVVIDVNGTKYSVDVAIGKLEVVLDTGSYPVVANYTGDDKYDTTVSGPELLNVEYKAPENITITIDDVKYNITPVNNTTVNTGMPEELEKAIKNSTDLKEQLDVAKANATDLKEQLDVAKANATDLKEQLDVAKANATDLKEQLDVAKANATDLKEQLDVAKANATDLKEQLDVAKANATDLKEQLDVAKANATDLKEQLDAANSKVDNLTGELDDANVKVDDLTEQLDNANAKVDALTGELDDANAKVDALTGDLADAQANATKLADDLADANAKVDDLTRQLEEALANKTKSVVVDGVEYPIEYVNGTATVTTNKTVESKFVDIVAYGDLNITATLVDSLGNVIPNANIVYSVGNVTKTTVTDDNGVFTIKGVNNEQIVIGYAGDGPTLGTNTSMIFKDMAPVVPTPIESRFNIPGNSITITGYAVDTKAGEKGMLYATELLDSNGNPIANVPIQFAVNNKIYNRTTLENGSFNPYHLDMIRAGRYTLALSFGGNENYTSTLAVACIDLAKKPLTIKASAKTYKASAKTKKYTITLSTIVGSSLDGKVHLRSGLKVTLSINGKDYTSKINTKGQATFNLKLSKKGTYTAKITTKEDGTYETTTKSVKITIK